MKGRYSYAQTKRIYVNRTSGRDCHHRVINGDIDTGTESGERTGQAGGLS